MEPFTLNRMTDSCELSRLNFSAYLPLLIPILAFLSLESALRRWAPKLPFLTCKPSYGRGKEVRRFIIGILIEYMGSREDGGLDNFITR